MANKIVKITLKLKDEFSSKLGKISQNLKRFGSSAVNIAGKIAKSFLKVGSVLGGLATVAFGGLIKGAIGAASEFETLKLRLAAVSEEGADVEKRFKEIRKFAAATPLNLDDLVKAEILLKAVGAASQENLMQVAEVASVMGRSVEDVALAVGSLESETLKKFGIQLRKTGDQFTFEFRDKAGDALKVVAEGADAAREALTDVFGQKFGGSLEKSSNTIAGKWTTFKDAVKEAFATIGQRLLPTASRVLTQATEALNSLVGSGRLEKLGDKLAEGADRLIDWLTDVKPTFDSITKKLVDAGVSIGAAIAKGFLSALSGVFTGIGSDIRANQELKNFQPARVSEDVLNRFRESGAINLVPGQAAGTSPLNFPSSASIAGSNAASAQARLGTSSNNPLHVQVNNQPIGGLD